MRAGVMNIMIVMEIDLAGAVVEGKQWRREKVHCERKRDNNRKPIFS
jgi:hypothetical protein